MLGFFLAYLENVISTRVENAHNRYLFAQFPLHFELNSARQCKMTSYLLPII